MQTIVYQCDTAMPAQKLPNCCIIIRPTHPAGCVGLIMMICEGVSDLTNTIKP